MIGMSGMTIARKEDCKYKAMVAIPTITISTELILKKVSDFCEKKNSLRI